MNRNRNSFVYSSLILLLTAQLGLFIYGCGTASKSAGTSSPMASTSALSLVIKDAVTGNKVPMSSIFVNKSSLSTASTLRTMDSGSWAKIDADAMGHAELTGISPDSTVMIKVEKSSYESYSKTIDTGKALGGYTISITTDESKGAPSDSFFDPTATPSAGGSAYACSNASTCMSCGCNPASGIACGGGCGCSDPSTNCNGGGCRVKAGGTGASSFGKCNAAGCPPGCKSCGACECTTSGGCGGSSNCTITVTPGGSGSSASSGACSDKGCPPGCKGCGACVCTTADGCGGASKCSTPSGDFKSGGGGCSDGGCPTGCRSCGACSCSSAGSCGGSTNCTGGSGGSGGGGTGGPGGSTGPGCSGAGCPPNCATTKCGGCSCTASTGGSCVAPHGGSSWCTSK